MSSTKAESAQKILDTIALCNTQLAFSTHWKKDIIKDSTEKKGG